MDMQATFQMNEMLTTYSAGSESGTVIYSKR